MNDYYEITTPPTDEPVSLAEAKLWLRRGSVTSDDDLITALISAATGYGEKYCNRVFVERTFESFFDEFCITNQEIYPFVELRRAPFINLTSFQISVNDVFVDVDSDAYDLKRSSTFSRIILFASQSVDSDVAYPVKVVFTAGYGAASAVPEEIKTAIKQHVLFLYENRGDVTPDGKIQVPLEVRAMYSKFRILNTF